MPIFIIMAIIMARLRIDHLCSGNVIPLCGLGLEPVTLLFKWIRWQGYTQTYVISIKALPVQCYPFYSEGTRCLQENFPIVSLSLQGWQPRCFGVWMATLALAYERRGRP